MGLLQDGRGKRLGESNYNNATSEKGSKKRIFIFFLTFTSQLESVKNFKPNEKETIKTKKNK